MKDGIEMSEGISVEQLESIISREVRSHLNGKLYPNLTLDEVRSETREFYLDTQAQGLNLWSDSTRKAKRGWLRKAEYMKREK